MYMTSSQHYPDLLLVSDKGSIFNQKQKSRSELKLILTYNYKVISHIAKIQEIWNTDSSVQQLSFELLYIFIKVVLPLFHQKSL